jgi:predicted dehydrogenase
MIRVGVIGYGYWGPNLARNFAEATGAQLVSVSDSRPDRLAAAQRRFPSIATTTDARELLKSRDIDAVVVATPVSSHYQLALQALWEGKHVLVEKPMAATSEQARRLIDEANRVNKVLMVDHTFVYSSAVSKIKELIDERELLGDLYYYDAVRVNLGLFRHDVNVIWDLAMHDLSIMNYVLPGQPVAVSATGMSHVPGEPEDIAYLTLFYQDRMIAHVHVNWLAPVKVRRTLIGGSEKMIVYDDLEPSEKIKVYDKGITLSPNAESVQNLLIGYRTGDMWAPQLDVAEALQTEALHFICCIEESRRPLTDGAAGLNVVEVLEGATRSMHDQGRLVNLLHEKVKAIA